MDTRVVIVDKNPFIHNCIIMFFDFLLSLFQILYTILDKGFIPSRRI